MHNINDSEVIILRDKYIKMLTSLVVVAVGRRLALICKPSLCSTFVCKLPGQVGVRQCWRIYVVMEQGGVRQCLRIYVVMEQGGVRQCLSGNGTGRG